MRVITENAKTYPEDPARYFDFARFIGQATSDFIFFAGLFDFKALDALPPYQRVVYLDLEEPNRFFVPQSAADFHHLDRDVRFATVYTLCPFTAAWLNRRHCTDRWVPVFFPFNEQHLPLPCAKEFDVIYSGGVHSPRIERLIQEIRHFNYRFVSQTKHLAVTDFKCSYAEKLSLIARSRVTIVHNLLFPDRQHVEQVWRFPDWRENAAFSQLPESDSEEWQSAPAGHTWQAPQLKSRLFEAAFCRSLILCQRDQWSLVERFFEPGTEFIYFEPDSFADTLRDVLANYSRYEEVINRAHARAMRDYTTKAFFEKYLRPFRCAERPQTRVTELFASGDLVFDVGANVGDKAAEFVAFGARVVCFEPQPDCAARLRVRFGDEPHVVVESVGLAAKSGELELSICSSANTISTFSDEWKQGRFANYQWDRRLRVPVVTLDDAIAQHGRPAYVKIDVEGFELDVLRGLSSRVPLLSFEFTAEFLARSRDCARHLESLGFHEFNAKLGTAENYLSEPWLSAEELFAQLRSSPDRELWGDIYARDEVVEPASPPTFLGELQARNLWHPSQPLRLHLGCGERRFDGYVNVDFPPSEHTVQSSVAADLFADLLPLDVPAANVDEVRLHHVFEHFDRPTSLALLCRWQRWLKPGGRLILETPDAEASTRLLTEPQHTFAQKQVVLRHLFGSHEAGWARHCDGWYPAKFQRVLGSLGFGEIDCQRSEWQMTHNVTVTAVKVAERTPAEFASAVAEILRENLVDASESEIKLHGVWMKKFTCLLGDSTESNDNAREDKTTISPPSASSTSHSPVVSIFIPAYNREQYLPATLDSLLAQTFVDFEIVIADDGSLDRTLAIARDYAQRDPRIRVLTLPHRGEVAARNEAVMATRHGSRFVMNHDSDDLSLPDKLARLVAHLEAHPNLGAVGCFAEYFDDAGNILGRPSLEHEPVRIRATFGELNSMVNSATLIRRAVMEKVGPYRESFRSVDDYDFFARTLLAGCELANIPEVLHRIRLHPTSVGSTCAQQQEELATVIRTAYEAGEIARPAATPEMGGSKHASVSSKLNILSTVGCYTPHAGGAEAVVDQWEELHLKSHAAEVGIARTVSSLPAEPSASVIGVIFSKDRPLQLDGTLRSFFLRCRDSGRCQLKVLYLASVECQPLYDTLVRDYPAVEFVAEKHFRRDLLRLLSGSEYVLFLVDDNLFIRDFSLAEAVESLRLYPVTLGFSLRLGPNTTFCYPLNKTQSLPRFETVAPQILSYDWTKADGDFNYPMEVSSSIYRTADVLPLLRELPFKNPNTLEGELAARVSRLADRPQLLCFEQSRAFCNPINVVQRIYKNRAGGLADHSPERLAQLFRAGARLDVEAYKDFTPNGCHQEVPLHFERATMSAGVVVSIVVPCYKQAHYLPDAVQSVVAQTFADWELIVVSDGSPDDTVAVAQRLARENPLCRIRLLIQHNQGLAIARNNGIATALGRYILPLDADDAIAPDFLAKTVAVLEADPGTHIVYTDLLHFGDADCVCQTSEFTLSKLMTHNRLTYCSIYRREVFDAVGGYNPNMVWGYEDWDFWIGAAENGFKARKLAEPLFHYRVKAGSMLATAEKHDTELRARIVLNHPKVYDADLCEWAVRVWTGATAEAEAARPTAFADDASVMLPNDSITEIERTARKSLAFSPDARRESASADVDVELRAAAQSIEVLDWACARDHYCQALALAQGQAVLTQIVCDAIVRLDGLLRSTAVPTAECSMQNAAEALPQRPSCSFCIITNGKRPEKLRREIESIRNLGIPNYEVLVGGNVPAGLEGVTVVPMVDAAQCGRLGEMRNRLTERARFDHLVVADDDLVFLPDFYEGLVRFGEDYQVQCVRFLNPDGSRYWDWTTFGGPRGHVLLPYGETDPHVYVTGGLCIMKAGVAKCVKWDESLGYYEGEDTDFSSRLHAAGISIKFNSNSTVVHHDVRLTQCGEIVVSAEGLRQTAIAPSQFRHRSKAIRVFQWLRLFKRRRGKRLHEIMHLAEQAFQRLRLFKPEVVDANSGIIHALPEALSVVTSIKNQRYLASKWRARRYADAVGRVMHTASENQLGCDWAE